MKNAWLFGIMIGAMAMAGGAAGATYVDSATNYPDNTWTNGSNGGTGFGAWSIVADGGAGGWAGCGIWNSAVAGLGMGEAFGYVGKVGYVNIDRPFAQALNVGDSFGLDFGVHWDSDGGNKGFSLFANGVEVVNVNHGSYPGEIQVNGASALTNFGTNTMRWTFTQEAADRIAIHATGRDGIESYSGTTTVANGYGYVGAVRFYSSGLAADAPDERQSYFDHLTLEQEGTPPPEPLSLTFTGGTWNPAEKGEYAFELTREGAVGDNVELTSDNPAAVTVPRSVEFATGSNVVTFMAQVESLFAGSARIVASNAETGVWAEYVVTPVEPTLSIGGAWQVYVLGPQGYTLTRVGSVGNTISLSSSDPTVLTVPPSATFAEGTNETTFSAMVLSTGTATIRASNVASGVSAAFEVTVSEPSLVLSGPVRTWAGMTNTYMLTRFGPVNNEVNLSCDDANILDVPRGATFDEGASTTFFQAVALAPGRAEIGAYNDDATAAPLSATVLEGGVLLADDDAGKYTPASFGNGANEGFGFGAWNLWNAPAELGDSTEGGGGDINSTNGLSFRFMGDGAGGWCNGRRDFARALQTDDVVRFTFTYNWDGGGRGVDIFSESGQFANLVDVTPGNTFKVNGTTVSTEYSPGAVVTIEIMQMDDGIQVGVVRTVGGTANLVYTTKVVHGEPATGVSMYCGGYTATEGDNPNYAVFMNDMTIYGRERTSLAFTGGTWNPSQLGNYAFELTREGAVTDEILLTSDNEASVTVPEMATFAAGASTLTFNASVISLTSGEARIVASNVASGAWAEYIVRPTETGEGPDFGGDLVLAGGDISFSVPAGYALFRVYGADAAVGAGGEWVWRTLELGTDYTFDGTTATILTENADRMIVRIGLTRID